MQKKQSEQYWASLPGDEFLDEAHAKIKLFYEDLEATGLATVLALCYRAYYGAANNSTGQLFDSAQLTRSGKNASITNLIVNHYRNLLRHTLQLATSQKPAYGCRATNSDYKSQAQCILGKGVLDYYLVEKKVSRIRAQAIENGLAFLEGWIHAPWNTTKGEIYDRHPETGAPIYQGDKDFSVHNILDVPRDITLKTSNNHQWRFIRQPMNKWDLAAKYPAFADDILKESPAYDYEDLPCFNLQIRDDAVTETDLIYMWTFYHEKTDSMKQGRQVNFINSKKLFDGPLPYRRIPLFRFTPDRIEGTPYGYSPAVDLLGPQQAHNILSSTIMSNQAAFGVQSVWTKRNDNVSVTTLSGGMKNLQSDEMPQAVQLTKTAPETFDFRQQLEAEMETLIGISATVRGNPEASLKSGNALALIVSQSIQFANLIEEDANELLEDLGTSILEDLRDFGKTPRVMNIMGESSRPYQKTFSGDDISSLNRVVVEQVSPLSKTIAGRAEIANNLLQQGMIKDPNQYIMVLTTGQLDPAIEGTQHKLLNMRAENEDLRNGKAVVAIVSDNHAGHIQSHLELLDSPDARKDPQFVARVLAHNSEHLNLWRTADPSILMITGQQPPPPPAPIPGMMPQPMQPDPSQQGAPQGNPGGIMQPQDPRGNNLPGMPQKPNLPPGAPVEAQAAYEKQQLENVA